LQIVAKINSQLARVVLRINETEVRRFYVAVFLPFNLNSKATSKKTQILFKIFLGLLWGTYAEIKNQNSTFSPFFYYVNQPTFRKMRYSFLNVNNKKYLTPQKSAGEVDNG
jgi:hypothetical protein